MREHSLYPDALLRTAKIVMVSVSGVDAVAKAKAAANSLQPAKAGS